MRPSITKPLALFTLPKLRTRGQEHNEGSPNGLVINPVDVYLGHCSPGGAVVFHDVCLDFCGSYSRRTDCLRLHVTYQPLELSTHNVTSVDHVPCAGERVDWF